MPRMKRNSKGRFTGKSRGGRKAPTRVRKIARVKAAAGKRSR